MLLAHTPSHFGRKFIYKDIGWKRGKELCIMKKIFPPQNRGKIIQTTKSGKMMSWNLEKMLYTAGKGASI